MSKEEAQGEILNLLAVEPDLCYDDISDKLRIEMEMVVDICIELEDEGSHQGGCLACHQPRLCGGVISTV